MQHTMQYAKQHAKLYQGIQILNNAKNAKNTKKCYRMLKKGKDC